MAPRKNDENTVKKTPRKRVVKPKPDKPKLRTPTIVRLKIPLSQLGPNSITQKSGKKQLTDQKKLELANEVALAQLSKDAVIDEAPPQAVPEPKLPTTTKRKRKCPTEVKGGSKPVKLKRNLTLNINTEDPPQSVNKVVTAEKMPKRKAVKKPVATKSVTTNNDEKKAVPEVTTKKRGRKKEIPLTKANATDTKLVKTVPQEQIVIKEEKIDPVIDSPKTPKSQRSQRQPKVVKNIPNGMITRRNPRRLPAKKVTASVQKDTTVSTTVDNASLVSNLGEVASCKSSRNSSASSLSWTHDISTSSTNCVTVTSNSDFVRFNNKLPVVKLIREKKLSSSSSSSSESSQTSSSSSSSPSSESEVVAPRELNLSASSPSEVSPRPSVQLCDGGAASDRRVVSDCRVSSDHHASSDRRVVSDCRVSSDHRVVSDCRALSDGRVVSDGRVSSDNRASSDRRVSHKDIDLLSAALDQLMASLREIAAENERPRAADPRVPAKVYDAARYECDVITHARNLRRILSGTEDVVFARPAPPRARPRPSEDPRPAPEEPPPEDASGRYDQSFEDDDALSLFAESITGIDSSRVSTSAAEEYVPAPVASLAPAPRLYRPTRIEATPAGPRPPCEKHSADSTSVRAAVETRLHAAIDLRDSDAQAQARVDPTLSSGLKAESAPALHSMSLNEVGPVHPSRTAVARGRCYFYITAQCYFDKTCKYSHAPPDAREVQWRTAAMTDSAFLRECALVRDSPALQRHVGLALVAEAARRRLTRALLELTSALRGTATQPALETALLHLNSVELDPVQDLLAPPFSDALFRALANTQNFSRFRSVFAKLARHASASKLEVPLDAAARILERFCILPSDEPLARAMLAILERTDPRIFQGESMSSLEVQLANISEDLHKKFLGAKLRALQLLGPPSPLAPEQPERGERYTSPDTTQYDALCNLPISPMITRVVDLKRARTDTTLVTFNPSVPPPNMNPPKPLFEHWPKSSQPLRRPLVRPDASGRTAVPPLRTDDRMTAKKRPITTKYSGPNKYQRMTAGDYYD